jgi:hypothetical protein
MVFQVVYGEALAARGGAGARTTSWRPSTPGIRVIAPSLSG